MPTHHQPPYDDQNIFAKLLRGEIPSDIVYADDSVLAFRDINPQAPIHVLVIPRGRYVSFADFSAEASAAEMAGFWQAVAAVTRQLGLEKNGYRLIANTGPDSAQTVPHFHVHILAGHPFSHVMVIPK